MDRSQKQIKLNNKNTRALLLACSSLLINSSQSSAATTNDAIDTNRPSFMFSPIVLPKGSLQVENGTLYQGLRPGWAVDLPETQLRLGLGHTTELSAFVPNEVIERAQGQRISGATNISEIGIKQQLRKDPGRFNASVIAGITVPTAHRSLINSGLQATFRLPYSYALNDRWSICGMQSLVLINRGETLQWQPDALVCRNIGSKASAFMEYAGFFTEHKYPINLLHFGGVYKVTRHQQVDTRFGVGLNQAAPSVFAGLGYSFRIDDLF